MKKMFICLLIVTSFVSQAAEKPKKVKNKIEKIDGCTVTIGQADINGNEGSATATAPTCSEAERLAKQKLSLSAA